MHSYGRAVRTSTLLAALCALAMASGGPAAARAGPLHLHRPGGYTGDPPQGFAPESRPSDVTYGWPVVATVDSSMCREGTIYSWSIGGAALRARPSAPCRFTLDVPARGATTITLTATRADDQVTASEAVNVDGRLIVTVGDSVASGEGNPDIRSATATMWQSRQCHRSALAAPSLAAQQLQQAHPETPITFVSVACSGATARQGLIGGYVGQDLTGDPPPLGAQLDAVREIAEQRPIDALVISVGANDLHFADVIKQCLPLRSPPLTRCFDRPVELKGVQYSSLAAAIRQGAGELSYDYATVAAELANLPIAHVYLMQYFDPTTGANSETCGRVLLIKGNILDEARTRVLDRLNALGGVAARLHRWTYVSGAPALFRGHGYCARHGDSWIVRLGRSISGQSTGRLSGTMHPNAKGHEALSGLIVKSVEPALFETPAGGETAAGDVPDAWAIGIGGMGAMVVGALGALGFRRRPTRGGRARGPAGSRRRPHWPPRVRSPVRRRRGPR